MSCYSMVPLISSPIAWTSGMTRRLITLCSRRTYSRIGLLPIFSSVVGTLTVWNTSPHLGDSLEKNIEFHGDSYKFCRNIGWRWEVENHFQRKGKVEGKSDWTFLLQCLCWGFFELDFVDNKQCEERKKGYYPTYYFHPYFWWSLKHLIGSFHFFPSCPSLIIVTSNKPPSFHHMVLPFSWHSIMATNISYGPGPWSMR